MEAIFGAGILALIFTLLVAVLGILVYFIPSIIAYKKEHKYKLIIFILNIVLGWTFVVWIGLLIWSLIDVEGKKTNEILKNIKGNKYEDLAKLQNLKDSGAISEEEFEKEKKKILD